MPRYHSEVDDNGGFVHKQENWQQSLKVINDYGKGQYEFQHVPIREGLAYYGGKQYNASSI